VVDLDRRDKLAYGYATSLVVESPSGLMAGDVLELVFDLIGVGLPRDGEAWGGVSIGWRLRAFAPENPPHASNARDATPLHWKHVLRLPTPIDNQWGLSVGARG